MSAAPPGILSSSPEPDEITIKFDVLRDFADSRGVDVLVEGMNVLLSSHNSSLHEGPLGFIFESAMLVDGAKARRTTVKMPGRQTVVDVEPVKAHSIALPATAHVETAQQIVTRDTSEKGTAGIRQEGDVPAATEAQRISHIVKSDEKEVTSDIVSHLEAELLKRMKTIDELEGKLLQARRDASAAEAQKQAATSALVQAKEMWMKESARATKIREHADQADSQVAEKDLELAKLRQINEGLSLELSNLKQCLENSTAITGSVSPIPSAASVQGSSRTVLGLGFQSRFTLQDSYFGSTDLRGKTVNDAARDSSKNEFRIGSSAKLSPVKENCESFTGHNTVTCSPRGGSTGGEMPAGYLVLSLINDAILFEDEALQVGVKAQYDSSPCEGVLGIYVGNKTSCGLDHFSVEYSGVPVGLSLTAGQIAQQIAPKQQLCQRVAVSMSKPFVGVPCMTVKYIMSDATPRTKTVRLPVGVHKFCSGVDLHSEDLLQKWRSTPYALSEAACVVNLPPSASLAWVAKVCQLGSALRLNMHVDAVPENIVLAGHFPASSRDGISSRTVQSFTIIARVEVATYGSSKGMVRITVRSGNDVLSEGIKSALADQLTARSA